MREKRRAEGDGYRRRRPKRSPKELLEDVVRDVGAALKACAEDVLSKALAAGRVADRSLGASALLRRAADGVASLAPEDEAADDASSPPSKPAKPAAAARPKAPRRRPSKGEVPKPEAPAPAAVVAPPPPPPKNSPPPIADPSEDRAVTKQVVPSRCP